MENLEHSVYVNNSLSNETKEFILSTYSLGKSSFVFWNTGHAGDVAAVPRWLRDIGGFAAGVGATFACYEIFPIVAEFCGNPITNGVATAAAASAREDEEAE